MARNLPDSEIPDVREYVYVDTDRVRSLLSQMSEGLPDEKATTETRVSRLRLGSKLFGIERGQEAAGGETLSLADLHVSMLEETAAALGLLAEVSDKVRHEKFWLRGRVRNQLQPGMLLRVTAPTLLVDPGSIMDTMRAFETAVGDTYDEEFEQMLGAVEALYGRTLALSIRPTQDAAARSAFVGSIPTDHGFSPMSRELLLSRIGPDPVQITSLIQVARIPTEHDGQATAEQQLDGLFGRLANRSGDTLDREVLDSMVSQMGGLLEQHGFAAAPKWPAISVVPLALYRNVLPIPALDDLDDEED